MFRNQRTGPKKINEPTTTCQKIDTLLIARNGAATNAEHIEKLIPECLILAGLARFISPFASETKCFTTDVVPADRHALILYPPVN